MVTAHEQLAVRDRPQVPLASRLPAPSQPTPPCNDEANEEAVVRESLHLNERGSLAEASEKLLFLFSVQRGADVEQQPVGGLDV